MKTERFGYLYLLFGGLCGFLLGSTIGEESAIMVRRMLFAALILFIAFSWRGIEARAHQKHLEHWDDLELGGKWRFILAHYLMFRGFVFFLLLVAPAITSMHFSGAALGMLAFAGSLLVAILLYLGNEEWNECSQEMEILALRQTGEYITSQQN
jgi:hypothetical protein